MLGLQSRFVYNWGQITWNLSRVSPKRDWSSKRVKVNCLDLYVSDILHLVYSESPEGHLPAGQLSRGNRTYLVLNYEKK